MVIGIRLVACSVLNALALFCASAYADANHGGAAGQFTVGRYLDLQTAEDPQISPDGTQIVYTRSMVNRQEDKMQTAVWIVDADGQHHRFLATGNGPMWAPDGKSIAYLAEGEPKGVQIFVLHLSVPGPATQLTSLPQAPANLHWSPDGRRIGFTMEVPDPEKWSVDLPAAPEGAKWASAPFYTESLHYRRDGVGLNERASRQLFIIAADGGAPRQVTTGSWRIGETVLEYIDTVNWGFTPDGRSAIAEGFREGDADRNDQDCYIYSVDLETGATTRLTTTPGGWREPAMSPDGKTIAYVGFVRNGDSYRISDLWTMSADGSNATLRSAGFDREPQSLTWAPDSSTLYFTAEDRGSVHLYSWSAHGGVKQLTQGAEVLRSPSASAKSIVVARSDFDSPQDLQLLNAREPKNSQRLTHLDDELLRGISLAKEQEIWFESSGGARIQGWLVKPPGFDPNRHYPLLLEIHGGPHGMYNVGFNPSFENFAANGYLVLYLNPRGSTGYGNEFGNAIAKHYPGPDYDDLMAATDAVIKEGSVDQSHMFVAGCSGGGVLSSWVIGHTNRFAAAAVRCPVIDWISMAGETDIPYFTYRFFKKPYWEDPSDWLEESSLMHVGAVKTPTLLMTGELDRRTPIAQTEEFYAALKYRGVPAALLRFDGEYHGTGRKPSNWMRTQLYMLNWFRRFGGNADGPPPS
ncbi:MAG: peptidase prolyl oligopeptidase active site domain protein [Gammaproteobacteria bacterium]|nr:peptidase prolyl oligopeptidase active site domain protein [Gammaproteobacteria bacterium]